MGGTPKTDREFESPPLQQRVSANRRPCLRFLCDRGFGVNRSAYCDEGAVLSIAVVLLKSAAYPVAVLPAPLVLSSHLYAVCMPCEADPTDWLRRPPSTT